MGTGPSLCCAGKLGWQPEQKPVRSHTKVINEKSPLIPPIFLLQSWPSALPVSQNWVSAVKYSTVETPETNSLLRSITWTQMSTHRRLPGAPSFRPTVCLVSLEMKYNKNEDVSMPTGQTAEILRVRCSERIYELIKRLSRERRLQTGDGFTFTFVSSCFISIIGWKSHILRHM